MLRYIHVMPSTDLPEIVQYMPVRVCSFVLVFRNINYNKNGLKFRKYCSTKISIIIKRWNKITFTCKVNGSSESSVHCVAIWISHLTSLSISLFIENTFSVKKTNLINYNLYIFLIFNYKCDILKDGSLRQLNFWTFIL